MSNYIDNNKKLLYEYLVNHDEKAYKKLVEGNVKLVHFVINKIANKYSERLDKMEDEYFGLGCLALEHAINKFDINKIEEVSLSTYAVTWIESRITRALKRKIDDDKYLISMQETINDGDDLTFEGILADEDDYIEDFIEHDYKIYKKNKVQNVLSKLNDEERKILELYYGFEDGIPKTYYRISEILGINKYTVKKIIENTTKKLKVFLKEFKNDYEFKDDKQIKKEIEYETNELHEKKKKLLNIIKKYDRKYLKEIFEKIKDDEKRILFMYCGVNKMKSYDLKYISKEMEIDEESVKEIIKKAVDNICYLIDKKDNKKK